VCFFLVCFRVGEDAGTGFGRFEIVISSSRPSGTRRRGAGGPRRARGRFNLQATATPFVPRQRNDDARTRGVEKPQFLADRRAGNTRFAYKYIYIYIYLYTHARVSAYAVYDFPSAG